MDLAAQAESVVIVGGGVIGVACAHYLSEAGLKVTVVDRGEIAGGCSLGNCGYICPSHVLPLTEPAALRVAVKSLLKPSSPFYVRPRMNPAFWRWLIEFARRCTHKQMLTAGAHLHAILQSSMAEYKSLVGSQLVDGQWSPKGLLYVMKSQHAMEEFTETDHLLSETFGVAARRIEGSELPAFDPALKPDLAGAFLYEGDAHVRPDVLVNQWAEQLKRRGVTLLTQCDVQDIEIEQGRVRSLRTSQGEILVGQLVVASGAWSPKLSRALQCRIPIEPGKGYSLTTTRPDPCPRQSILLPERRVGVTPFDDGFRLGSMMEFVGYDETIPERRIEQLRTSVEDYLVNPHTDQELSRWYGWRPMTWDSLPLIGQAPKLENTYLATGHNMLGMSMGPATGKLIAELITGRPTHLDVAAFSPARFQ